MALEEWKPRPKSKVSINKKGAFRITTRISRDANFIKLFVDKKDLIIGIKFLKDKEDELCRLLSSNGEVYSICIARLLTGLSLRCDTSINCDYTMKDDLMLIDVSPMRGKQNETVS